VSFWAASSEDVARWSIPSHFDVNLNANLDKSDSQPSLRRLFHGSSA
jgi:hypothetical protein